MALETLATLTRAQLGVPFTDWRTLLAFEAYQRQVATVIPDQFNALSNLSFVVTALDTTVSPNAKLITAGANINVAATPGLVTIKVVPAGTSGQIQYNNAGVLGGFTVSGDATLNTSTGVLTLATVNANVGTWGDGLHVAQITLNAKGLATAAASVAIPVFTSIANGFAPLSGGGTANFLRADGTWAVPPGTATVPTGANPTATAGPTAVNGSAATFMRSDAAPAVQAVSIAHAGLAPTLPNDATKYLDGTGAYSVPAGSGAVTKVSTQTVSGATSVLFSLLVGFDYKIVGRLVNQSATANLNLQLGFGVGPTWDTSNNYFYQPSGGASVGPTGQIVVATSVGTSRGDSLVVETFGLSASASLVLLRTDHSNSFPRVDGLYTNPSAPGTAMRLLPASGTISGIFSLYSIAQ